MRKFMIVVFLFILVFNYGCAFIFAALSSTVRGGIELVIQGELLPSIESYRPEKGELKTAILKKAGKPDIVINIAPQMEALLYDKRDHEYNRILIVEDDKLIDTGFIRLDLNKVMNPVERKNFLEILAGRFYCVNKRLNHKVAKIKLKI